MSSDDLVNATNKAEARTKIHKSTYLDQYCPKGNRALKMSFNSWDDQAKKIKATPP